MTLVTDLFKGKFGLAQTYWLWGGIGGVFILIGYYIAFYILPLLPG